MLRKAYGGEVVLRARHCLARLLLWHLSFKVSAEAVISSQGQTGEVLPPSSCGCWQNSVSGWW